MKKAIIGLLLVGLTTGGVMWYRSASIPESTRIIAEMRTVLDGQGPAEAKLMHYAMLRTRLAGAYRDEKKYDQAIRVIEEDIETTRRRGNNQDSRNGRRITASYEVESAQFRMLVSLYDAINDETSATKARKKADGLDAQAARAKKYEPESVKASILD